MRWYCDFGVSCFSPGGSHNGWYSLDTSRISFISLFIFTFHFSLSLSLVYNIVLIHPLPTMLPFPLLLSQHHHPQKPQYSRKILTNLKHSNTDSQLLKEDVKNVTGVQQVGSPQKPPSAPIPLARIEQFFDENILLCETWRRIRS